LLTVTATNTGNQTLTGLILNNTNTTDFEATKTFGDTLGVGYAGLINVKPKPGLAVGNHSATISVTGPNSINKTFTVIFNVDDDVYKITKNGEQFAGVRGSAFSLGGTIQAVIDAIRDDGDNGKAKVIQFGDGANVLDIGTADIIFINSTKTWGALTLTGKITSAANTTTINISNGSVTSSADIKNTATGVALTNNSINVLNINGGTISATSGNAVNHASTGSVNISGGTISATSGNAVINNNTGSVNISGGNVMATTGSAISNLSTAAITVSGSANINSSNTSDTGGTIILNAAAGSNTIYILGGTVTNLTSKEPRVFLQPAALQYITTLLQM